MATYGEHLTLGQIPHLHAQSHLLGDKTAVIEGDTRLNWSEISTRTAQLANGLSELGVGKGTKVAVLLTNRVQYPEIVYAIAGLGAAVVPISYRFTPGEIDYAVRHSDAEVVIVDGTLTDTFAVAHQSLSHIGAGRVLVISDESVCKSTGYIDYETVLADSSSDLGYMNMDEWDVYHLAYTGGTSGDPKACEIPQRIARQAWYDITVEVGNRANDVTVIAGPFYHGLGFTWGLQQLMVGGTVVMLREFNARELLQTIERERVSFIPMVPTMFEMLLEVPDKASIDVSSVRRLMSAGSPLLTATKERLMEFLPAAGLYELYGSTEAGFFSILKPQDQRRKDRSAGLPYFGCELRILDPDGDDVPVGAVGEIYKRGPGLGVRYYKNPEATEEQFRGEWISSGDLGRFDDEGYLYVVDRAKDMIISGGVNIFPTEIENVLVMHPDVVEAAVIGRNDPKWGEIVTAYVVTRQGIPVPADELDALCREKLASYKRPRTYLRLDELPKNASGKLLKRVLKERMITDAS
ncbi:AMP-binding protein [Rhodococcus sp. IEGM 1366]|uniref:class I adenylate-forming enzyme family protein n=1 Tax=Rhodococcus sp. IEGM 1366 TaxID=3082223 RepID=UPI002952A3FC|nr:AMP-binding protein [Rhodococcus sp. IEGM 1366]MDV8070919.1 AMP-binding protein [Rhodococcus sp. IEGM 1366]